MKYAAEVIDLMAAYPGRQFKMLELVRHVTRARSLSERERAAVRKAVSRVLVALEECGQVWRQSAAENSALYAWCPPRLSRLASEHLATL